MLIACIFAHLLSATVVNTAVTGRQDGSHFFDFDEVTGMFPGMGHNFHNERQYEVPVAKSFVNHFSSSVDPGVFQKSKEQFGEQPETHRHAVVSRETASNRPHRTGWAPSTSRRKHSGSNEVQPEFRNRQNLEPTHPPSSQERSRASSDENEKTVSKESLRRTFKPRERKKRPDSRERHTPRSGEAFMKDKEGDTPNVRRRLHFRERMTTTRSPNSRERPLSEEIFLTDKDPVEIPVRQTFRELKTPEGTQSQERITSRSGEKEEEPFVRRRKVFRERINSNEYNSNNPERPRETPAQINRQANQEESSPRTGESFLTDDEDTLYFPDNQDLVPGNIPTRQNNKENNPPQPEERFLTDKDDFSNMIANRNDRKPIDLNKPIKAEVRLPPQSEETFLTDDEDFPIRKPDNLNQINGPHQKPQRSEESFQREQRPQKERFRAASIPLSSQENNIADNFLTDDEPNPLPPSEKVEPTANPQHLGRVRWPPPKSIDESNEKPPLSLGPLFYEDTFGIVPPLTQHSVETEDEKENPEVKNRMATKRIRKPSPVGVNLFKNGKKSSRKQGEVESEENDENDSHENESSENDSGEGNNTPTSHESNEDHSAQENDDHEGDDVHNSDETHSEDNGHEEEPQEEEHVEDSDESPPIRYNNPREPPAGDDSGDSHHESEESVPESIHESEESPAEGSEEAPPEDANKSEESDHESDEGPPESGHNGEAESDESPAQESPDSEESPPEDSHNSEEAPAEDSEESFPGDNHASEESSAEDGSEESLPEFNSTSEESPPEENEGSEESQPEENQGSEESPPEENPSSEETPPEENQTSDEFPPVSNSDESNNNVESEEQPPKQNAFSLEELFPHESAEQDKPEAEEHDSDNNGNRPPKFESNKRKPGNTYFGVKPFTETFQGRPSQDQKKPEDDFEDVLVKSSEEHEEPDFPEIPKRKKPKFKDNKLKPASNFEEDKKPHSSNENAEDVNFSSEINLDSFEFDDVDVLEAPPSSELGSPTTSKPSTTVRPTSLPVDCAEGDDDQTTPHPIDLLKAKKPIKTAKPSRRPGDEVSIAISGPRAVKVKTTKATTTTTTPKPVSISAIGVMKPGGEIIAKVVQPTTPLPQGSTAQAESPSKRTTTPSRRGTFPRRGTNNPRRGPTTTTTQKMEPWKAALAAREATALTYLKPPPLGQPQTWLMTAPPPSPMFRLFVV